MSSQISKRKTPVRAPATPRADKFTSRVLPAVKTAKIINQFG